MGRHRPALPHLGGALDRRAGVRGRRADRVPRARAVAVLARPPGGAPLRGRHHRLAVAPALRRPGRDPGHRSRRAALHAGAGHAGHRRRRQHRADRRRAARADQRRGRRRGGPGLADRRGARRRHRAVGHGRGPAPGGRPRRAGRAGAGVPAGSGRSARGGRRDGFRHGAVARPPSVDPGGPGCRRARAVAAADRGHQHAGDRPSGGRGRGARPGYGCGGRGAGSPSHRAAGGGRRRLRHALSLRPVGAPQRGGPAHRG